MKWSDKELVLTRAALAGFLVSTILLPLPAAGQRRARAGPESAILIGYSRNNLSDRDDGFTGFAGLAFPVGRRLLVEPALGYLTYRNDFGQRTHWLFPELSIQAQLRVGAVRPFLGIGGGAGIASRVGSDHWEGTLLGTGGIRLQLARGWGGRAEIRGRAVPPWSGHSFDFNLGVIRGFF